jgi:saccharopine dehydrogenase-like NADP-dependent oxidoreductase
MSGTRVTVLGTGLIGKAMVHDLCRDYQVRAVDRSEESLKRVAHLPCERIRADASDPAELARVTEDAGVVVSAMPGVMGYRLLEELIRLKKHVVDISFTEENPLALEALAKEHGVTVWPDAGVCPGLSNAVCGFGARHLFAAMERYVCYVGGLPAHPKEPWFYRNPFAAVSVVDEYTRPCRFRINGEMVVKEALSEPEDLMFPEAGELVAFNTDGIRTLLDTLPEVGTLVEKTLRHPAHYTFIRKLQQAGFMDAPYRETFAEIAAKGWRFEEGEEDITIMRLVMEGLRVDGGHGRVTYELLDHYDRKAGLLSMARTTGFTATGVARMVLDGDLVTPGVHAPEKIGMNAAWFSKLVRHLNARGVHFRVAWG